MLVDWFTVGAQALNFLILVWLMRRFLYKPILHALHAREERIAAELADAAAKMAEAQKERDAFERKNEEFERQRAAMLGKVTEDAKAERSRLFGEVRKAADALRARQAETMRSDAHNLNQAIQRRTQEEVFAIARKTLADLATTSLEERMAEVFIRRLRNMDGEAKASLAAAIASTPDPALVRSALELPAEQRAAIQKALDDAFSTRLRIRFETAPALVGGIEVVANGQKLAWSISDYLASLEKTVGDLLKTKAEPAAKGAPEAAASRPGTPPP